MVEALVAEAQENARQQAELAAAAPSQPMVVRKDAGKPSHTQNARQISHAMGIARDIVLEARAIILRDLRTSFENDLRKRLAATHIANGWSNHEAQKDRAAPVQDRPTMSPTKPDDRPAHPTRASEDTFKRRPEVPPPAPASRPEERAIKAPLPSFGRQAELAASRSVSLNQRQYSSAACRGNLNEDTPSRPHSPTIPTSLSEKYDDVGIGPKSSATRLKRARSEKTKSSKKKNKSYKVEQLHFTSSEEEDEGDNDIASDRKVGPTVELAPVEKESQVDVQQVKEEEDIPDSELLHIIIPNKQEDQAPLEAVITLPTPTASESNVSSAKRELSEAPEETAKRPRLGSATPSQSTPQSEILTTEPPATETAVKPVKSTTRKPAAKGKGRGKRGAKQKKKRSESPPRPQVNLLSDLVTNGDQEDRFYLKLALSRIRAGHGALPADDMKEQEEDAIEELEIVEPRHETGCARTEGYYKIPQPEKLRYLLARNQAKEDSNKEGHSSLSISRLARANARHLASGLDKHKKATATDTDLLQLNQLRTRKKQLRFARSPIHDWGLYALELIPAGEMVIEYVGEQIRQQVADKREKGYERQGIGSSYLL